MANRANGTQLKVIALSRTGPQIHRAGTVIADSVAPAGERAAVLFILMCSAPGMPVRGTIWNGATRRDSRLPHDRRSKNTARCGLRLSGKATAQRAYRLNKIAGRYPNAEVPDVLKTSAKRGGTGGRGRPGVLVTVILWGDSKVRPSGCSASIGLGPGPWLGLQRADCCKASRMISSLVLPSASTFRTRVPAS